MSNSINYKIQKYNYKLKHAKNKRDANLYKSKLQEYKQQSGGDWVDELAGTFSKALGWEESVEQNKASLNKLKEEFNSLLEKLREQCCKKNKNCTQEINDAINVEKTRLEELVEKLGKETNVEVSKLITENSEEMQKLLTKLQETPCPGEEGAKANDKVGEIASLGAPDPIGLTDVEPVPTFLDELASQQGIYMNKKEQSLSDNKGNNVIVGGGKRRLKY
jgi:hypothetical protein